LSRLASGDFIPLTLTLSLRGERGIRGKGIIFSHLLPLTLFLMGEGKFRKIFLN